MDREEVARLRVLAATALRQGKWSARGADGVVWVGDPQAYSVEFADGDDAVYAAEAANACPVLLDEVNRLCELLSEAERMLCVNYCGPDHECWHDCQELVRDTAPDLVTKIRKALR